MDLFTNLKNYEEAWEENIEFQALPLTFILALFDQMFVGVEELSWLKMGNKLLFILFNQMISQSLVSLVLHRISRIIV